MNRCSVCSKRINRKGHVEPTFGSVCLNCLNVSSFIFDPIYKVKFPKCSCGKNLHPKNLDAHREHDESKESKESNENVLLFQERVNTIRGIINVIRS